MRLRVLPCIRRMNLLHLNLAPEGQDVGKGGPSRSCGRGGRVEGANQRNRMTLPSSTPHYRPASATVNQPADRLHRSSSLGSARSNHWKSDSEPLFGWGPIEPLCLTPRAHRERLCYGEVSRRLSSVYAGPTRGGALPSSVGSYSAGRRSSLSFAPPAERKARVHHPA